MISNYQSCTTWLLQSIRWAQLHTIQGALSSSPWKTPAVLRSRPLYSKFGPVALLLMFKLPQWDDYTFERPAWLFFMAHCRYPEASPVLLKDGRFRSSVGYVPQLKESFWRTSWLLTLETNMHRRGPTTARLGTFAYGRFIWRSADVLPQQPFGQLPMCLVTEWTWRIIALQSTMRPVQQDHDHTSNSSLQGSMRLRPNLRKPASGCDRQQWAGRRGKTRPE